jgi:23S rRNA (uridine2552-2'-O)-methyltransferase
MSGGDTKGRTGGGSRAGSGNRKLAVRLKTAKGRTTSSQLWLSRQLNDPYVAAARRDGYRSRAVYKLLQIHDRYKIFKRGQRVIDLGAAPGGWSQAAANLVRSGESGGGQVIAIDISAMEPIADVSILELDFMADAAPARLKALLAGHKADVVLSDMAAPATGHRPTDHLRIMALCEAAIEFAGEVLAPGGTFVAKVLQGGTERALLDQLKASFATVRHVKPEASRADSAELYVLATGFKGR